MCWSPMVNLRCGRGRGPFPPLRVAATVMERFFGGKMPADGTFAARCPREASARSSLQLAGEKTTPDPMNGEGLLMAAIGPTRIRRQPASGSAVWDEPAAAATCSAPPPVTHTRRANALRKNLQMFHRSGRGECEQALVSTREPLDQPVKIFAALAERLHR